MHLLKDRERESGVGREGRRKGIEIERGGSERESSGAERRRETDRQTATV